MNVDLLTYPCMPSPKCYLIKTKYSQILSMYISMETQQSRAKLSALVPGRLIALISSLQQTWKYWSTSLFYFKFVDIRMEKDVEVRCTVAWQLRSMLQRRSVVDRKVTGNQRSAGKFWSCSHRVTVLHDFVYKCPSTGCSERKNTLLKFFNYLISA